LHYYKVGTLVTSSATTGFSIKTFLLVDGTLDESNLIFSSTTFTNVGRDRSFSITTGYGLDGPGIEKKIPGRARFFAHVLTGPGAHPASCTVGTGSFPGVKLPGRYADHSSAEVTRG
jgi:hypothetical protein